MSVGRRPGVQADEDLSVISDGNLSSASPQHRGNLGELVFLQGPRPGMSGSTCPGHTRRSHSCVTGLCFLCGPGSRQALATWSRAVSSAPPASQLPAERAGEKEGWRPREFEMLRCCHQQGAWVPGGQTHVFSMPPSFLPEEQVLSLYPCRLSLSPHPAGRGRWPRGRWS